MAAVHNDSAATVWFYGKWDSGNDFRGAIFSFSPVTVSVQKAIHLVFSLPSSLVYFLQILQVTQYFLSYDLQKCILLKSYKLSAFCIHELRGG
jgi:hypothetical protein